MNLEEAINYLQEIINNEKDNNYHEQLAECLSILKTYREKKLLNEQTKYKCLLCKDTGYIPLGEGIRGIKACPRCNNKSL